MKIIITLFAFLAAVTGFAASQISFADYGNGGYRFVANSTGFARLEYSTVNLATNTPVETIGAGFVLLDLSYKPLYPGDTGLSQFMPWLTGDNSVARFEAGDTFGVWLGSQVHIVDRYTNAWYDTFIATRADEYIPYVDSYFELSDLTFGEDSISGYKVYYRQNGDVVDPLGLSFTLSWLGENPTAPKGQPLPGVLAALAAGAGAYVIRRKQRRS